MTDHDQTLYQARLHWVVFCWPVILFFAMLVLAVQVYQLRSAGLFVAFFALIWILVMWVKYRYSYLDLKSKHIILCSGILVRQTVDIPLSKIESVDIRQTLFGSILRYGSIMITGTGGTRQAIHYLSKPLTCRRYIEQLMHE